jgi:hypothetical protein
MHTRKKNRHQRGIALESCYQAQSSELLPRKEKSEAFKISTARKKVEEMKGMTD